MKALFLSDNEYFCIGVKQSFNIDSINISSAMSMKTRHFIANADILIIEVEQLAIRREILKLVAKYDVLTVMLEKGMFPDQCFKLHKVIYISVYTPFEEISTLVNEHFNYAELKFSNREMEFFKISYLTNKKLSILLSISIKTCSAYRIKIQDKICMRFRNDIAMERVRQKMIMHMNAFGECKEWESLPPPT